MQDRAFTIISRPATLIVSGPVDEASVVALRTAITEATAGFRVVLTIVLSDVDYLPSLAVGVLAKAMQSATRAGGRIDLVAAPGSVAQRVLAICVLAYRESLYDDTPPAQDGVIPA